MTWRIVGLIVGLWLAFSALVVIGGMWIFRHVAIDPEDPRGTQPDMPAARARGREDAHDDRRPGGDLSPLSAAESRYAGARDETIGRDQYRPEAARRIRELQPFSLRQREAADRVMKGE